MPGSAAETRLVRNVAIIAHVDHGKTTLVDQLLKQSGMFRAGELEKLMGGQHDLIMDSNPLERERGITILSKNCAVTYHAESGEDYRINIIDTPGHADFGGEVERVLRMADGCLVLVDALDGPMPQTKFVLSKALEAGLKPIVIVNKCDRPEADPPRVVGEMFDLLVDLGADDHALEFKVVYAAGRDGWASYELDKPFEELRKGDLRPIFETIIKEIAEPGGDREAPLQMLVTTLDYSEYVGRIGIGRVYAGVLRPGVPVMLMKRDGTMRQVKVTKLLAFAGLGRKETDEVGAGDLCAVVGVEGIDIGDTLADVANPKALPPVTIDEPTISMLFRINDSPFAGQEGQYVTSRQIRDRLMRELEHNVALRVEPGRTTDEFNVSGRGLLHLGILLETMRREGFELSVARPQVILHEEDGVTMEPMETLVIDVPNENMGSVMELVGGRRGEMKKMEPRGQSATHLVFDISSRALIGLRSRIMTASQGEAIMHHRFSHYAPVAGDRPGRINGVLISLERASVTAHAVELLSDRGFLFVKPGDNVYAGQIVGEHNRDNDLVVNITREKALTNMRAASKDQTVVLKPPRQMSLEACLEYVEDDELVEITPTSVRMRKRILSESERRRSERQSRDKAEAANT